MKRYVIPIVVNVRSAGCDNRLGSAISVCHLRTERFMLPYDYNRHYRNILL